MSQIHRTLDNYDEALKKVEKSGTNSTPEQLIAVLAARDTLHVMLTESNETQRTAGGLLRMTNLDERLEKQGKLIAEKVELADYRRSLKPPPDAWWWFFDTEQTHPWDRLDWLWSVLTLLVLTASLSLLVDISSRFLSDELDIWGTSLVVFQSMLTLLAAGGALTDAGREVAERILGSFNVPKHWWQEIKLGVAGLLFLLLFVFRLSLPQIAVSYNDWGVDEFRAGQLSSAETYYNRAINLNPDYVEAHYNLGRLYEELLDVERARTEYRIAVVGEFHAAYDKLAGLYIEDENYSATVALLLTGLDLAEKPEMKYNMLYKFGWARLGQARYAEAEEVLQEAIELKSDRAPAYCLLAQVLEAQEKTKDVQAAWENCIRYAKSRDSDEDMWIGMAREYFAGDGGK